MCFVGLRVVCYEYPNMYLPSTGCGCRIFSNSMDYHAHEAISSGLRTLPLPLNSIALTSTPGYPSRVLLFLWTFGLLIMCRFAGTPIGLSFPRLLPLILCQCLSFTGVGAPMAPL